MLAESPLGFDANPYQAPGALPIRPAFMRHDRQQQGDSAHPGWIPSLPTGLGCPISCGMEPNHDDIFGMTLHQQVVNLLELHRERWCCDRCLTLALDRREQHVVEHITDTLAASEDYSRSRGFCRDCHRVKLVTMANRTTEASQPGVARFI